jgi:hypothetical protein
MTQSSESSLPGRLGYEGGITKLAGTLEIVGVGGVRAKQSCAQKEYDEKIDS